MKRYARSSTRRQLGVDTFVLDDGWFGKRDSDSSGLGDWYVNERNCRQAYGGD
ncbi:MAG: alpha-galactosidase [Christensenellaceae bacterium]